MELNLITLNALFAIVSSSVLGFVVGALWYSPLLFGKKWMKLKGITKNDIKFANTSMVLGFLVNMFVAYCLYILFTGLGVSGFLPGFMVGLLISVGFIFTNMLTDYIYEPVAKNKNLHLLLLNAGHRITTISLMCGLIALF